MAHRARKKPASHSNAGTKWGTLRANPPTLFYSIKEAAALLRCQEATVRRMIAAKELRAVRIGRGRNLRIPRSVIEALAAVKD